MKKLLSMLLTLVLILSLAACGSDETSEKTSDSSADSTTATEATSTESTDTTETTEAEVPSIYPEETILIGVEIYDPTESETLEIMKYFEYLSENFNVEFKYSEAIQDAEQEMKFIEDCAIAGAKGFYGYYNVSGVEQVLKVQEYGMYFVGGSSEIYEAAKNEPNYLGIVSGNGSDYDNGHALGEWVMEQGLTNVIYANGGADFGVGIFVDRQAGFMDAIDESVTVTVVRGFPGDQFFADQAAALATPGLEAVIASFNGVDFWAQPIAAAGLSDVHLATIGAINENYYNAFENGQLAFLVAGNIEATGFGIIEIINAVDGHSDLFKEAGVAVEYAVPTFTIDSSADIAHILQVQSAERIFSADLLKTLVVGINPEADLALLKSVADSRDQDSIIGQ